MCLIYQRSWPRDPFQNARRIPVSTASGHERSHDDTTARPADGLSPACGSSEGDDDDDDGGGGGGGEANELEHFSSVFF